MNDLELINKSYCISCDHIKKINEEYKRYNDTVFNKQFTCMRNKDKENYLYNKYVNYNILKSAYINKKTCYNPVLNEQDARMWELLLYDINGNQIEGLNPNSKFNENTRRKTRIIQRHSI
jgi:hypothetical protein